jgi:hypothetical protein
LDGRFEEDFDVKYGKKTSGMRRKQTTEECGV